jgi:hypothetical protein
MPRALQSLPMNHNQVEKFYPGIGRTEELSLRVSVGGLVRVLFEHPNDGEWMLALERKATLLDSQKGHVLEVKSQPFGGALRLLDLGALQRQIGDFHFDSEKSQVEQDFRIFIRHSDWEAVRAFCLGHLGSQNDSVLESDPRRELTEEFADALKISLKPDQYTVRVVGTIVEDHPSATEYIHARGYPTARIYRIFEANILDPSLVSAMTENSETCSNQDLYQLALEDSRKGGRGRANGVLNLPFKEITATYLAVPWEARNFPIWFQEHQLDETVAAVLEGLSVPKYQRVDEG